MGFMKRDNGKGELVPAGYEVVSCSGPSDHETVSSHATLEFALAVYEATKATLKTTKGSDVRLYVKDKQGYMNCIKSWIYTARGVEHESDRLQEL
jgi:hypothetical protein